MIKEIQLLNVSERVYEKYKRSVKNNGNISLDTCRRKLTRNFILGTEVMSDYENQYIVRKYGKLRIFVDMKDMNIVNIENRKENSHRCYINPRERDELNKLLGLENK